MHLREGRRSSDPVPALPDAASLRIALLVAQFNREITDALADGARALLEEAGVEPARIERYATPGAWELPQAAARLVEATRHDAVVALGCVVRGETPHFDVICAEASRGLGAVARRSPFPVTFGVLTTDTVAQARERADPEGDDKGGEAARAALEMVALYRRIGGSAGGRDG